MANKNAGAYFLGKHPRRLNDTARVYRPDSGVPGSILMISSFKADRHFKGRRGVTDGAAGLCMCWIL